MFGVIMAPESSQLFFNRVEAALLKVFYPRQIYFRKGGSGAQRLFSVLLEMGGSYAQMAEVGKAGRCFSDALKLANGEEKKAEAYRSIAEAWLEAAIALRRIAKRELDIADGLEKRRDGEEVDGITKGVIAEIRKKAQFAAERAGSLENAAICHYGKVEKLVHALERSDVAMLQAEHAANAYGNCEKAGELSMAAKAVAAVAARLYYLAGEEQQAEFYQLRAWSGQQAI